MAAVMTNMVAVSVHLMAPLVNRCCRRLGAFGAALDLCRCCSSWWPVEEVYVHVYDVSTVLDVCLYVQVEL
jgi:recombinational DNA repair protein (RecF pathway)